MREEATDEMMELAGLAEMQVQERGLAVRFVTELQENEEKTKNAGRRIHDEVDICEIRIAGDPDVRREHVNENHKRRFPKQYLAFIQGKDQDVASGTPLAAWPIMSRALVEDARYFGVRTVEQLADLADSNLQKLGPGWSSLRQKARDYLLAAKDGALLLKLRTELEERDRRIDALEKMLTKQAQELHRDPTAAPVEAPNGKGSTDEIAELRAMVQQLAAKQAAPKRKYVRRKPVEPVKE